MTETEITDEDKEKLAEILAKNKERGNHRYDEQERSEKGQFAGHGDE